MLSFAHTGNRLTSLQCWDGENLPGIALLTYDQMGNQLSDSRKGLQFSYNLLNLPSKAEGMAGIVAMLFEALSALRCKNRNKVGTNFAAKYNS